MGDAVGLGQDHRRLVGVAPPGDQDPVGQFHQPLRLGRADPDHRHGPLDNAGLDVLKAGEGHRGLHGGLLHGEGIAAALEVVVGQNGAAYDGQIGVGAHEVMGELPHKVQQLSKTGPVDLHGSVDAVQADAVLIVVDIGGVLHEPGRAVDGDGNDAVVLPGGVVHPAGIALILGTQGAPGVVGGRQVPGGGNGLGVLLRLGQVDGDVQLPILCGDLPLHIPGDAVPADIVGILAEFIVPVRRPLGILPVQGLEGLNDLSGPGGEASHQLGVKQIPVDH